MPVDETFAILCDPITTIDPDGLYVESITCNTFPLLVPPPASSLKNDEVVNIAPIFPYDCLAALRKYELDPTADTGSTRYFP